MQIMGHNLGVLFSSGVLGNSDYERFIVWDWVTGVQRGVRIIVIRFDICSRDIPDGIYAWIAIRFFYFYFT